MKKLLKVLFVASCLTAAFVSGIAAVFHKQTVIYSERMDLEVMR